MMNIVDTSGWVEYYSKGKNSFHFAPVIEQTQLLLVPSIVLYETFKKFFRQYGKDSALEVVTLMKQAMVTDLSSELAIEAAALSHETGLAMADSIILATAQKYDATLWTQDADFKGMAGVKYFEKKETA